jgi:hypothetical protein
MPSTGTAWVADATSGDAVVASPDAGATWQLRDAGIAGQRVYDLQAARSDSRTVYALTVGIAAPQVGDPEGCEPTEILGLYATTDAGADWSVVSLPSPLSPMVSTAMQPIQVDPLVANRLWAVWPSSNVTELTSGANQELPWAVYESDDGGASWNERGPLPPLSSIRLTVIHSALHPRRLVAWTSGQGNDFVSDDDGASWAPVTSLAPLTSFTAADPETSVYVVVDPAQRDRVVIMADKVADNTGPGSWRAFLSNDGLSSVSALSLPGWWDGGVTDSHRGNVNQSAPLIDVPSFQADRLEDVYFNLFDDCQGSSAERQSPICASSHGSPVYVLVRFRLPALAAASGSAGAGQGSGGGGGGSAVSPASTPVSLTQDTFCRLPVWTGSGYFGYQNGSVTFDGKQLLYTNPAEEVGKDVSVVHTMDPRSCGVGPDIRVTFSDSDLRSWAAAQASDGGIPPQGDYNHPVIDDLAYDPVRNALWVSISNGTPPGPPTSCCGFGGALSVGLFVVRVDWRTHGGTARLAFLNGCGEFLTYDYATDRLWTCLPDGSIYVPLAELSASSGTPQNTCLVDNYSMNPGAPGQQMATFTLASPSRLYVWSEDDVTLGAYDTTTCQLQATYVHPAFVEPLNEDEQMACDSLTYGVDGVANLLPGTPPHSVLWVRDAEASIVRAYAIPDGQCPTPTRTTYAGTPRVISGGAVTFCSSLFHQYLTGEDVLPRLPISFSVAGPLKRENVASVTSPVSGQACTTWKANVPPGTYTVTAQFDPSAVTPSRVTEYLPSQFFGTLVVVPQVAPLSSTPLIAAPAIQLPSSPNQPPVQAPEAPVSQAQAAGQAEAQGQMQAQAQAQAQSQTQAQAHTMAQVQPGMMVQAQRRTQVATQEQGTGMQTTYQASALQRPRAPGFGIAVAFLMFGFGVLVRRPRSSTARLDRGRFRRV